MFERHAIYEDGESPNVKQYGNKLSVRSAQTRVGVAGTATKPPLVDYVDEALVSKRKRQAQLVLRLQH